MHSARLHVSRRADAHTPFVVYVPTSSRAGHVAAFTETMATGKPVYQTQDMRLRTRSGEWIWFRNSFTHCGLRWHAMLRNLSEAKRVEVRANRMMFLPMPAAMLTRACAPAAARRRRRCATSWRRRVTTRARL
jgi:hypothetical protein